MRLLKIIGVIFIVYFIRRFIQMYRVLSRVQQEQQDLRRRQEENSQNQSKPKPKGTVIEADFKVVDR